VSSLPEFPTGTVTFLFTDVEGSTQLWERHHDAMRTALADHDLILREAVESQRGVVFKTVGDAFCAAFVRPEDALAAALDAQRRLAAHPWPPPIDRLRVRMGIHTGTAVETAGDYFGPTVNRVARLMSLGYGEQVLVSNAAALLLRDVLPADTSLRDLGAHRLKDLRHAETAYQVVAPGLRTDFPALRSLDVAPHNLPIPLTTFYGRDGDLASLTAELKDRRLVTLTGFGGVGKTRLALEAGWRLLEEFPDGVFLVELAPLSDPNLVASRIATVLGLPEQIGQLPGYPWLDALRDKRALLIVDNCEHVIDAVSSMTVQLLQRCAQFRVLATSREPLHVTGERVMRISPLGLPAVNGAAIPEIRGAPAVQLFLDRVADAAPDFSIAHDDPDGWRIVEEVCARLDGIPLALELAAARVGTLGLLALQRGLENRFRFLRGRSQTPLPRQQTLQATLDWSYTVLGAVEQAVFDRLGVFAGSFTAEAAATICASDTADADDVSDILASLADKSLIIVDPNQETTRYRLLETTRAYALERIGSGEGEQSLRRRHAEYYQSLSLRVRAGFGARPFEEWADQYRIELDNFRAALAWAIDERGDVAVGAQTLCNLTRLMEWLSLEAELIRWCERAIAAFDGEAPPLLEAEVQLVATRQRSALGEFGSMLASAERAAAIYRAHGARLPLANALTHVGRALSRTPGRREEANRALDEALAIFAERDTPSPGDGPAGEPEIARHTMAALATAHKAFTVDPADYELRRALLVDALLRFRTLVPGHWAAGAVLAFLSEVELEAGCYEAALERARESIEEYHRPGSSFGYIFALYTSATALFAVGAREDARAGAGELLGFARRIGSAPGFAMALLVLAAVEAQGGDPVLGAGLLGAWDGSAGKRDTPVVTSLLSDGARASLVEHLGDDAFARLVKAGTRWTLDETMHMATTAAEPR
jgi:predicted ATPase/class 3 adenylate cyclase